MNMNNKLPLIRATQLEAFRKYIEQSDYASYEITEQSVIDSISGAFEGNTYTRIGKAFHKIVEEGTPKYEKVKSGERTFLYYGKEQKEQMPSGRAFDIEGNKIILDIPQCKAALAYRNEHPDAFHEIRLYKDFGNAIITGCADMIDGVEIRDIKTKYSYPIDADYINSCQWKFYLQLFNADIFHFDLFIFEGYDKEKHGYDVRGIPLKRYGPAITCYRYDGMEQDNYNLLRSFLEWAEYRDLTKYLLKETIE